MSHETIGARLQFNGRREPGHDQFEEREWFELPIGVVRAKLDIPAGQNKKEKLFSKGLRALQQTFQIFCCRKFFSQLLDIAGLLFIAIAITNDPFKAVHEDFFGTVGITGLCCIE